MSYFDTRGIDDNETDEAWIFSYADLMTLLLGFFIILYSFSKFDEKKFDDISKELVEAFDGHADKKSRSEVGFISEARQLRAMHVLIAMLNLGDPESVVKRVEELQKQSATLETVKETLAQDEKSLEALKTLGAETRDDVNKVEIMLPAGMLFSSGRYTLNREARQHLRVIGRKLAGLKELVTLEVVGHTDGAPLSKGHPMRHNFALSSARAGSVAAVLLKAGLPRHKVRVSGMGSLQPLLPERDGKGRRIAENMQRNRRVHIVVSKKKHYGGT